ncbi:embryo defective [Abeliophyllum distichum]|uniref:Embryo defective n=1 Tax=Abeliophyllum distichum TaxID=126358 RepID=A0ABD1TX62_9LAMI
MQKGSEMNALIPGSRQLNLKKSFKRALHSLLTACPKEEFCKAFPSFTAAEHERLHRLFIQVINSLHEDIETKGGHAADACSLKAGTVLDSVEELVEEHSLDPLLSEKSNVGATAQNLSEAKKNELHYLMGMLQKAEEHKRDIGARLELLKREKHDFSSAENLLAELRTGILNYENGHSTRITNT